MNVIIFSPAFQLSFIFTTHSR